MFNARFGAEPVMRTLVIVNETAGGGRCARFVPELLNILRKGGMSFEVVTTHYAGQATQIAVEANKTGVRKFIVMGGDGTTYEVINGLFPRDHQQDPIELGVVPLGTGNSFLRDFGVTNRSQAMMGVLGGRSQACDLMRLEHAKGVVFFINLLSLGFSATVGALRNERYSRWGTLGYALSVTASLGKLEAEHCKLRVDEAGEFEDVDYIMLSFSNTQYTGGRMRMAPNASSADGLMDMIHAMPMGRAQLLRAFPDIYRGSHVHHPKVRERQARKVWFSDIREQPAMIDGEVVMLTPRCLEVLSHAVRLRVP
jgi:YegS/Rv2252/BmrU family lipid kinase